MTESPKQIMESVRVEAIPSPTENPQLAHDVAVLILREQLGQEPSQEDIRRTELAMNDRTTVVAFSEDGNILATAGIAKTDNPLDGVIDGVAVHQINRMQGLGRRIVEEAEGVAKNQGISRIEVLPAHGTKLFYNKLGYNSGSNGWFVKSLTETK